MDDKHGIIYCGAQHQLNPMVRDPQWHCCWERKIYFHCIINFHNLMSLALDNRFIYPAHMMRSLKVHPLSDQFSSVNGSTCRDHKNILTWFLYFFFFILNSIFNYTFLFLLQITYWHCSIFFFVRLFWNFSFFFHLQNSAPARPYQ